MDDTTLDEYYEEAEMSFEEIFAITRYKMANKQLINTPKQEMMKNFIEEWRDNFGFDNL